MKSYVLVLVVLCVCIDSIESKSSLPVASTASAVSPIKSLQIDRQFLQQNILLASHDSAVGEGTSTILTSVFNLSKTILGAGILSLPAAVAAFSDSPHSLFISGLVVLLMGSISAYTFSSIGKTCDLHRVKTFKDAWAASVDESSAQFISVLITFKTFFTCLAYSIIIADSFSSVVKVLSPGISSVQSIGSFDDIWQTVQLSLSTRQNILILLTSTIVLPLCLATSLDALKYTSVLGLLGIVYCAIFMGKRLMDGSYREGGQFWTNVATPSFNLLGTRISQNVFILLSTVATAFVAHYNAPKFLSELKTPTPHRYNLVVMASFAFSALMYLIVMSIGFLTFGGASLGFILNNYAPNDLLATLGRLAIGSGILFGYPLTFTALREGLYDLFRVSTATRQSSTTRLFVTVSLLGLITSIAMVLRNLGMVLSLSGSLIGCALIYVIPAVMNLKTLKSSPEGNKTVEVTVNRFIVVMGIVIAVIGVKTTLLGAGGH